jgi:outer membrane receptor protein involved in Fe transport
MYPLQTSLRGAVAYRFGPELTTKLIAGRAFQTPSGTLLFAHGGFGNIQNLIGTERLAEPRPLEPQTVTSAELVAISQLGERVSLEGSLFYQALTDAIRFNQVGTIIVARNAGREVTAGAELVARLLLGGVRPYTAVSSSRQIEAEVGRGLAGVSNVEGAPALYPRLFGYLGVDVDVIAPVLFLNAELRWAEQRGASQANFYQNDSRAYSLPGYHQLDVTLTTGPLRLLDPRLGTRCTLSGRNLVGSSRIEPGFAGVDIPQPGPTLMLQISQQL